MNGLSDVENKLRNIRLSTSSQADERTLADATAEFERAVKVQTGRSWLITAGAAAVIIILAAAVMFLMHRGEVKQAQPQVTERLGTAEQAVQAEKSPPKRTVLPRRTEVTEEGGSAHRQVDDRRAKLARIAALAAAGDVNSLAAELETGDLATKMAVVGFLSQMSDPRAAAALDELAEQLDPNNPQDHLLADALGVEGFGKDKAIIEEAEAAEAETVTEPNTPAVEKQQPPEQYVTGWLTDVNGYAIEGKIQVSQEWVMTDSNGAFSIARPSFSDFISSFGWAVSNDGTLGTIFHWSAEEDLNDIEIVCVPFASASGLVVDVNSQPVSDFRMEIVPEVNEQSIYARGELKGPWEIRTEPNGIFEISSIPAGYPLALVVSKGALRTQILLGEFEPGEHLRPGEVMLEEAEGLNIKD